MIPTRTRPQDTIVLKPEVTEHEFQDLTPDTEYEFRVRAENVAGSGRDVSWPKTAGPELLHPPCQTMLILANRGRGSSSYALQAEGGRTPIIYMACFLSGMG